MFWSREICTTLGRQAQKMTEINFSASCQNLSWESELFWLNRFFLSEIFRCPEIYGLNTLLIQTSYWVRQEGLINCGTNVSWLKLHSEIFEDSMCLEEHETNGAHHKNKQTSIRTSKQTNRFMTKLWRACVLPYILIVVFSSLWETIPNMTVSVSSFLSPSGQNMTGALKFLTPSQLGAQTSTFAFTKPPGWMGLFRQIKNIIIFPIL